MDVSESRQGAVTILKPNGPLTLDDTGLFKKRVRDVLTRSLGRFVLDTSAVAFVDSAGLETLADLADELAESGQTLKLCGSTDTVREVLELTDLASSFEHFEDIGDAVRSFR